MSRTQRVAFVVTLMIGTGAVGGLLGEAATGTVRGTIDGVALGLVVLGALIALVTLYRRLR